MVLFQPSVSQHHVEAEENKKTADLVCPKHVKLTALAFIRHLSLLCDDVNK